MQESNVILQLRNVTKKFGDFVAIRDVDLDIYDGEFLTIVGPSGSGKTTMIRLLVGMDKPTEGDIHLKNIRINDVPANKRPTCMVFQSLALFPHRTVGQNIEFPLKIRGADSNSRKDRAMDLIRLLQLPENYYSKNVMKCSGGERQRVALARALAFDPEILFLMNRCHLSTFDCERLWKKNSKIFIAELGRLLFILRIHWKKQW